MGHNDDVRMKSLLHSEPHTDEVNSNHVIYTVQLAINHTNLSKYNIWIDALATKDLVCYNVSGILTFPLQLYKMRFLPYYIETPLAPSSASCNSVTTLGCCPCCQKACQFCCLLTHPLNVDHIASSGCDKYKHKC